MNRFIFSIAAGSSLALATGAAQGAREPELTPMQLQALQTHEYETTKTALFAAVVSVFQDLGYQLENADVTSGFITASSPNRGHSNFGNILAMQRASGHTRATAFIEELPNGRARVRLNFLNTRSTSSLYGQHHENDRPVLDAATYNAAWERIDEALFVRTATDASPRSAPGHAVSNPTPAAAPTPPTTQPAVTPPHI
jgi:hypothetical protein